MSYPEEKEEVQSCRKKPLMSARHGRGHWQTIRAACRVHNCAAFKSNAEVRKQKGGETLMNDWHKWIREIAYERIDQIERHLNASPEEFPEFAAAASKIDAAMDETDEHPDAKLAERDDLWMTYSAALALEMYLAGTRDGGRVYHAFITGELPAIQKREEGQHEQTDA